MSQLARAVQRFSDSKARFAPVAKHVVALEYKAQRILEDHKRPATITLYLSSGKEVTLVAKADLSSEMSETLFESMCYYVENTNV